METEEVREFRERKVSEETKEMIDFLLGDWERTEGFVGALSKQTSEKSTNAGVEEKARKAFEELIGSTARYGDGVDWASVALYFLYAGYIDGI